MRSSMLEDDGAEPLHEVVDLDIAFGFLAPPRVHAGGSVVDVAVADDQDVRTLLGRGPPDAVAESATGAVDHLGAESFGLQPVDDPKCIRVVAVADGQHGDLYRCQPRG